MHNRPTRRGANGECSLAQREADHLGVPHRDTGRLGTRAIVAPGRLGNDGCLRPAHTSPGHGAFVFRLAVAVTPSLPISRQLPNSLIPSCPFLGLFTDGGRRLGWGFYFLDLGGEGGVLFPI